jgi:hypothetical protein
MVIVAGARSAPMRNAVLADDKLGRQDIRSS